MKKIVPLSILIFLALNNFAQQEDSLLKNFKFRIDHYRALNFSLDGGGNYNKAKGTNAANSEYSEYSGNLGAMYTTVKSTDRLLQTSSSYLWSSYTGNNRSVTIPAEKIRNLNFHPEYRINNKWFNQNNSFFELDAHGSVNLQSSKYSYSSLYNTSKQIVNLYNGDVTIGVGKGRKEDITFMQNALWLYKDLKENNKLNGDLSYADLYELGKAINQANNTRVLDARRRTKYILKSVDEYLQRKNLINQCDINYFTSLNDILFFPLYNPRTAGTEKFVRLTPTISSNYQINYPNSDTKLQTVNTAKSALLSAGINTHTPLSLTRQIDYGITAKLFYGNGAYSYKQLENGQVVNTQKGNSDLKSTGLLLFYGYSIYPNTRTNVGIDIRTENGYQQIDHSSTFYNSSSASINMNYFISYQTYLTLSAGGVYNKNSSNFESELFIYPEGVRLFVNAGLNISL